MTQRVLTVKLPEELLEVLGESAAHLGMTRHAFARRALEHAVPAQALQRSRDRHLLRRIRARLALEQAAAEEMRQRDAISSPTLARVSDLSRRRHRHP